MNDFADKLDRAMTEAGLTGSGRNRAIAEAVGVSPQMITKYLQGKSIPSPHRVAEMAKLLGKTPDYFGTLAHSKGGRHVYHVSGFKRRRRDEFEVEEGRLRKVPSREQEAAEDPTLVFITSMYNKMNADQRKDLVAWLMGQELFESKLK